MDPQLLSLVRLVTIVLVPIVPALLLFLALPSKAALSGPFKGFKINLSGAFAAYFALVLIVISTPRVWDPAPNSQIWTVEGNLEPDTANGTFPLEPGEIRINPPAVNVDEAGLFKVQVATTMGPTGDAVLPSLTLNHKGFMPLSVVLDPALAKVSETHLNIRWNSKTQHIEILHIKLQPMPAYSGNANSIAELRPPEVTQP